MRWLSGWRCMLLVNVVPALINWKAPQTAVQNRQTTVQSDFPVHFFRGKYALNIQESHLLPHKKLPALPLKNLELW